MINLGPNKEKPCRYQPVEYPAADFHVNQHPAIAISSICVDQPGFQQILKSAIDEKEQSQKLEPDKNPFFCKHAETVLFENPADKQNRWQNA